MAKLIVVFVGLLSSAYGQGLNAPFAGAGGGFNNAPLTSEAFSEGACILPFVATDADPNWIISQKTFYTPIASQFAHHRFAETLLSRPPVSEAELETMCLTVEFSSAGAGLNITNVGYDDREFRETCPLISPGRLTCIAVGSSPGVNPKKTASAEHYVVAVDNRSYMLLVRCVEGYFRDYLLLTTRPTVSSELYNMVLNVTRTLGFDERRVQLINYDNCLRSNAVLNTSGFGQLGQEGTRRSIPSFSQRNRNLFTSYLTAPYARNNIGNQYNQGLGFNNLNNISRGGQGIPPGGIPPGGVPPGGIPPGFGGPPFGDQSGFPPQPQF